MDKYKTVVTLSYSVATALEDLEKEVNIYLKNGWKVQGGVYIVNGNPYYACQAVVK